MGGPASIGSSQLAHVQGVHDLGPTPITGRLAADLVTHASFGHKQTGGPGDYATADWIARRLDESGFGVEQYTIDRPNFDAEVAQLMVGGRAIEVYPQQVVIVTPAEGTTASGITVHNVYDASNARGRIAFLILPYGQHAAIFGGRTEDMISAVAAAGALAIVIVTTGPSGRIIGLNTRLKPMAPVPIAIMAPRDFSTISEEIASGIPITLTMTGRLEICATANIIATRQAGSRWLAFSTPRTGYFTASAERGTGTAAFLELAAWSAACFPDYSIFAANTGAHELDFSGMHDVLKKSLGPPQADTRLWVHLGASLATRLARMDGHDVLELLSTADPNRTLNVSSPLLSSARLAFAGLSGLEQPNAGAGGELINIFEHGYPLGFGVIASHPWFHTEDDTLDKTDVNLLLPVVQAHKRLIAMTLDDSP